MSNIASFTEIKAWRKSHELTLYIYKITQDYPKEELYGIKSQTRRAAASVGANIVEGFKRKDLKDSIKFYNIAEASLEELKNHLILARDLQYISKERYTFIADKVKEASKTLYGWVKSQRDFL
ncbi:MAG: four helix bundle protein [Candidatus Magasanikbacteria bacterium CG_4_9_14_0_2_um_filter_42_11]|uniref:Four helix bundle protein n=1 Tax=Candidatus Magasanikbacteria bacterium CG_4_9_14_0_2_um_filter_42_11 TaxID=1974643 RepID=A0A2M8F9S0_9BACT|nr:MAG: four helix bundle protein [Candidatus Magasanikbacteria bacterium CG10_big_fil_rev_8_21_14_0_10_43_9]PIY92606.1 MAG: four helix bundle protein [Candidatus Magasanikbacteria bacterium CG_4_10_14_0_8_um_filter_42_12]PJC52461.1 MAG: four helix bundle protein [Candidatus Magasanikbacteria bacterium CG_4_9_14_0_2_um_filter_42_11]